MDVFVALLRAVNVGGTGKLPMSDLKVMCEELCYTQVKTYIASGNVLFRSVDSVEEIKTALERKLENYAGRPVGVIVRKAEQMVAITKSNPFNHADASKTLVIFVDETLNSGDVMAGLKHLVKEEVVVVRNEIYVHYPEGVGQSKLTVPAARAGTARNMNTVKKLAELANDLANKTIES